ncbi:lamin tail domain-containing protein [Parapedobacter tibetensis]|uniref:lamin tail domain-containing protein n=1 Tax=Parapedobacter tibetensis TaxID=2972951 RepID=UPI00214DEF72|nr:lamin tail domain-containing protein [Parapedobacter tibetensis]
MKYTLLSLCSFFPLLLNAQIQDAFTHSQFPNQPMQWRGHTSFSYMAQPFDIIINEIMVNPNGVIDFPRQEYIELYNQSDQIINLRDWTYHSLTTTHRFSKGTLQPRSYLILCRTADTALFAPFGEVVGISPWPALVNSGTTLILKNQQGTIIDEVAYNTSWYRDSQKRNGGWSLERISPNAFCLDEDSWIASNDSRGGTPGIQNSVYDKDFGIDLGITEFKVEGASQLAITFSRALDSETAMMPIRYVLNHGIGIPQSVELIDARSILLHYDHPFSQGLEYILGITELVDCAGESINISHSFFIPDEMQQGDVLINEILSNPKPEGVDFVEIYNHSNKIFDLQHLYLTHVNSSGSVAGHRQVSVDEHLFYPNTYKVLTTNPNIIQQHYQCPYPDAFIQMPSLPAFNNNAGTAILISRSTIIDRLTYNESMQSPFITNHKGVSLERQSFSKATDAPGNFRSAATSVGGATPGYVNSQGEVETTAAGIFLTSKTFSPDNDGFEDLLEITYSFPESSNMANIDIYNDKGQLVKRLQRNQRMATYGTVIWDGLSDTNQRLPVGIYIAVIEVYNEQGMRKVYRKSFVLATKL